MKQRTNVGGGLFGRLRWPSAPSGRTLAMMCSIVAALAPVGCTSSEACAVKDDCWNKPSSDTPERCFPREVACVENLCRSDCQQPCEITDPSVNPCRSADLICNQTATNDTESYCAAGPIPCETVEDCPIYRPLGSDGLPSEWTCVDKVCRYPGLRYRWE